MISLITVSTAVITHSSPIPSLGPPPPSQSLTYFAEIRITRHTLPHQPLLSTYLCTHPSLQSRDKMSLPLPWGKPSSPSASTSSFVIPKRCGSHGISSPSQAPPLAPYPLLQTSIGFSSPDFGEGKIHLNLQGGLFYQCILP